MKKVIKSTTLADRLLFLLLVAGSVCGVFFSREAVSQSSEVVIEVDGRPAYAFPLDVEKTVALNSRLGETVVEIRDRKVRVREAHCANRICVKQGWVTRGVIVCLPNRTVIYVGGGGPPSKKVDAITG